jgi:FAD/FMN-containing dehydrogenase
MSRRRRWILTACVAAFLLAAGFLGKPLLHLARGQEGDRDTREPPPTGSVDDASRLNQTPVAEVFRVAVDGRDPEGQLRGLLARARAEGLRVSVAGARHSMGGHTLYPGGIVVDTRGWQRMELHEESGLLTVQAGALWKDVIPYLDRRGRSVAVMQSNHSFSVGGSLSVNCHGWQRGHPPIASTVESFRLMQPDGTVVRCSRTQNPELFSLALGGYGLFGIILDADLRVVRNERYRLEQHLVPVDRALAALASPVEDRPNLQMVFARMSIVPSRLFEEVILNALVRDPGEIPALSAAGTAELRRAVFRGSAGSDYGKRLRWNAETRLQPLLAGKVFSRNQLLNEGVEVLENRSAETTDILHEYFVPPRRAAAFVGEMRRIVESHRPDLLNVTLRDVDADTDTFLRYADRRMVAFVMLFVQARSAAGESAMEALTRDLVDAALRHEGRYYLPYRLHATPEQFHRAYPQARRFFELKRRQDPAELFQSQFYLKYGQTEPTGES